MLRLTSRHRTGWRTLFLDPGDPLFGQFILSGDSRRPRSLVNGDKNNWAPRVGFAWRAPGVKDLVVRSSFGIFYAQDQGTGVTNRMTSNPPFFGFGAQTISSDQLFPSSGFVLNPGVTIPRPAPIDPATFRLNPTATATLVSWPTYPKTPYVEQWNFSVEKSLPWNMVAELNYVGNHGVQLYGLGEGNQPVVLSATTVTSRRPLAQYTAAAVKTLQNWNMSKYQGLSGRLEKRFSSGLLFLTTFTYGHALDLQNPGLDLCDGCGSGGTIQNNYDRRANYASSDNDVRFRYVFAGSFELPFGKGKSGWAISPPAQQFSAAGVYDDLPDANRIAVHAGLVVRRSERRHHDQTESRVRREHRQPQPAALVRYVMLCRAAVLHIR